jgi:hypothetical protein
MGGALGTGLGLASAGYGVYDTATDSNLSTTQKAGHSGEIAANLAATLGSGGWYGLVLAAKALTGAMERSGSPQVSAAGRAIAAPALPVEGLMSVLRGDKSPRAAFNSVVSSINDIPLVGGAMGSALRTFGIGTKPTTGTMFRDELGQLLPKVGMEHVDTSRYQMPTGGYGGFDPKAVEAARGLGNRFAAIAPHGRGNADAYGLQAQNVLLNQYGNSIIPMAQKILDQLDPHPGASPAQRTVR